VNPSKHVYILLCNTHEPTDHSLGVIQSSCPYLHRHSATN